MREERTYAEHKNYGSVAPPEGFCTWGASRIFSADQAWIGGLRGKYAIRSNVAGWAVASAGSENVKVGAGATAAAVAVSSSEPLAVQSLQHSCMLCELDGKLPVVAASCVAMPCAVQISVANFPATMCECISPYPFCHLLTDLSIFSCHQR